MKNESKNQKNNNKTVSIITLGCKVNQYESDSIALALSKAGYNVSTGLVPADIYVLNSCAVTNEGERKSRGQIAKMLKLNPNARVYVCGCAAHHNPAKFTAKDCVQFVTGTAGKIKVVDAIINDIKGEHVVKPPLEYEDNMQSMQTRTRAFVKIQDGCNSFCSYCIIPYLRGRSRSRTIESIRRELDTIKSREVVFAGVDVSEYGKDLPEKPTLIDVVELMRGRSCRFRFSSLEMGSISPKLLEHLATLDNFCPHFHLSMQSGSNGVLKRMNRKHTKEEYLKTVKAIRKVYPNAGITTDVIVGFPGETEEEFNETMETARKANFYEMHVFPYSPREGTVAARLPELNGAILKARAKQMAVLSKKMKTEFLAKQIGSTQEVLIEKLLPENRAEGYTRNYVRVVFTTTKKVKEGDLASVLIDSVNSENAFGAQVKL